MNIHLGAMPEGGTRSPCLTSWGGMEYSPDKSPLASLHLNRMRQIQGPSTIARKCLLLGYVEHYERHSPLQQSICNQ